MKHNNDPSARTTNHPQQVSESNPWIEATPSVSLFYGGERAGEAETAANDEAFCELMSRVRAMAQGCDDADAPAGGETS